MSVEPSKQIQSGDAWPYVIDFKVKNITGVSLYFYPDQIDIGPYFKPAQTGHYGSGGIGGRMASSVHVGPIEPGSYDAKMRFWFELAPGPATAPPTIGTLTLEFPQRLEIVPHDRATPIRNDSTR